MRIDLRFEGDQASGSSGCNMYAMGVGAIGGSITFGQIRMTQMACKQPVKKLESAYLRALQGTTAYDVRGSTLSLTGGPADLTFTRAGPSASPTQ